MTLRLFDSRSGAVRDFAPRRAGEASLYVCGPTVQSSPHAGHLRSALVYDQLRRWLRADGLRVTLVRNVTDIDDKVLANATDAEPWWALAYRMELEFSAGYAALGIEPPTYEPRATASIPQMIELIAQLIDAGHAYASDAAPGDVWFDVSSWPSYGELTRQRQEDLVESADGERAGKRGPADFALWKAAKPGEPASATWAAPWGAGRPGWHIECSAMSARYLGDAFDVHGGGLDLRFPHHENELAQSTAAGRPFAGLWMHNGLVTVDGQKMSKSLGNSVLASDLLRSTSGAVLRYALGQAHYRSTIDVSDRSLAEAESALARITGFLGRAGGAPVSAPGREDVPAAFAAALDDDLAVPQALAVLHEHVTAGNTALAAADAAAADAAARSVRAMAAVLGLAVEAAEGTGGAAAALDALVGSLTDARQAARRERDFAAADRIRDQLAEAGIQLEDTPDGARWRIDGE